MRHIGRYVLGSVGSLSSDVCMITAFAVVQIAGTRPSRSASLSRLVRNGVISGAICLRVSEWIPSGPGAFLGFRLAIANVTSSCAKGVTTVSVSYSASVICLVSVRCGSSVCG